jgi:hypothetical protein
MLHPAKYLLKPAEVSSETLAPPPSLNSFPFHTQNANVAPTYNKGDSASVSNYRNISILNNVSEISNNKFTIKFFLNQNSTAIYTDLLSRKVL